MMTTNKFKQAMRELSSPVYMVIIPVNSETKFVSFEDDAGKAVHVWYGPKRELKAWTKGQAKTAMLVYNK